MSPANIVGAGWRPGDAVAGRYRISRALGAGGEGRTYLGADLSRGETVVLKQLQRRDDGTWRRAAAQVAELASLGHPHIARTRDLVLHGSHWVLVMDWLDAAPLAEKAPLRGTAGGAARLASWAWQLAETLAFLHERGVVHGDLAPSNVLVDAEDHLTLIDFAWPGRDGIATGTLGFAAPESLAGCATAASDLFSLGALLVFLWQGQPPFPGDAAGGAALLAGRPAELGTFALDLGGRWERLVQALLSFEEAQRPTARGVLALLKPLLGDDDPTWDLRPPEPGGDPTAGVFVGRAPERAQLGRLLAEICERPLGVSVVSLEGPAGSGRRTLLRRALADLRLARARAAGLDGKDDLLLWEGSSADLRSWAGLAEGAAPRGEEEAAWTWLQPLVDRLEAEARKRPFVIALDDEEDDAGTLSRFLAGAPPSERLLLLHVTESAVKRPYAASITLPPFSSREGEELVTKTAMLPAAAVSAVAARLVAESGGHAATLVRLWRLVLSELTAGRTWQEAMVRVGESNELASDRSRDEAQVSDTLAERLIRHALRAAPGEGEGAELDLSLRLRGWLSASSPALVPRRALRIALAKAVQSPTLAARALGWASQPGSPWEAAAETFLALGLPARAVPLLRAGLNDTSAQGDRARLLTTLAEAAPDALSGAERTEVATTWTLRGRAEDALRLLASPAAETGVSTETDEARAMALGYAERRAWILGRLGRAPEGRRLLERALASAGDETGGSLAPAPGSALAVAREAARARLARLLLSLGALEEVVRLVPGAASDPTAIEALILARAYQGESAEASRHVPRFREAGGSVARAAFLAGLVAQLADDPRGAAAAYATAREEARGLPDLALEASATLNEGLARAELGQYDRALDCLGRAVRDLGRLGARDELAVALFNAGTLQIELGRVEAAERAVASLHAHVVGGAGDLSRRLVPLLEARLARLRGDLPAALLALEGPAVRTGETEHVARQRDRLHRELEAALGRDVSIVVPGDEPEDLLSEAVVCLARGGEGPAVAALASRLSALAARDESQGRWPRALKAAARAARLWHGSGRFDSAQEALARARRAGDELRRVLPPEIQGELMRDSDVSWVATATFDHGNAETIARLSRVEAQLRRLLRINKRLNGETRLPKLLELIVDTVIELTDAERGLLLLEDEEGVLQVRVARNIDQETLAGEALSFSRSIAEQVRKAGKALVTLDAAGDPRFREAVSVSDLHLRSVLAVPLAVKGRVVGTIYVDHRVRRGVFQDEDVSLVSDFAEQAALALENARLLQELRRREREVETLNQKLAAELEVRKEELRGLEVELRESREALSLRYDYAAIVGRTPKMLEVFRLLDRLTDTQLPVVIQGESGTGKELIARALHFNGPRRSQAFVSENCAALPETLLESTLFGYVRGAFTGADQDRRGLFELADNGTLFLDEVGEMSPALQGKLLRVLQEGEFRRVGSEKVRKVNVRVVAATNRDLARMVQEGKFRQDLFYRLSVARIHLPPLRERREDIPAIVRHLLEKHRGENGPRTVDAAALVALTAYDWPGNVRELENEILRATAFAGDRIAVADLSPHIASAFVTRRSGEGANPADELALKPRVEALERALIQQALERHGGNQTRAAESLGLSRFGLQKKLSRYGLQAREHHN